MRLVGWRNNLTGEIKWSAGEVEDVQPRSFSGIHVIDPAIFGLMPSSGTFSITDVYLQLAANSLVVGYDHSGDIILDVGKPESLIKAGLLARLTFCRPSQFRRNQWRGLQKLFPRCFLGNQTYSCGDSSGIAPDSLLIPRTETLGLETKIDVNNANSLA